MGIDNPTLLVKIEKAEIVFKRVYAAGHPVAFAYSGGKDSSLLLNIGINAAIKHMKAGHASPRLYLTHSDTGVENPEVARHALDEMKRVRALAEQVGLNIAVHVVSPSLASSWAVRTIGQGKLPVYPGKDRDCTREWKITPQKRLRSAILKDARDSVGEGAGQDLVTALGVRFDESDDRKVRMEQRGDTAYQLNRGADQSLYVTPIAEFTTDEVWEYLAYAGAGAISSYSDFKDLQRIYADAGGQSCHVVADMVTGQNKSKACGARHGCWNCVAGGRDRSMEAMIDKEGGEYHYMRSLNLIQRWLVATRYDWDSRNWLPRSINEAGFIRIQPDMLGPGQIEDLFKFVVSADADEAELAAANGHEPRFLTINEPTLIAIDAEWSRLGFHEPFHAIELYRRIHGGERYYAPQLSAAPTSAIPPARFFYIGNDWKGATNDYHDRLLSVGEHRFVAEFSTITEMISECTTEPRYGANFDVDPEAAALFLDLMADDVISRYQQQKQDMPDITEGFKTYVRMGIVQLSHRQKATANQILRRTYFRDRLGLTGTQVNVSELLSRSIPHKHMKALLDEKKRNALERINRRLDDGIRQLQDLQLPSWLSTDEVRIIKSCRQEIDKQTVRLEKLQGELGGKKGPELSALKRKIKRCQVNIARNTKKMAEPEAHLSAVQRLQERVTHFLHSAQGQALARREQLAAIEDKVNEAYRHKLEAVAFIHHVKKEGISPYFDGIHYPSRLQEAEQTLNQIMRQFKDDPIAQNMLEGIRIQWYRRAIDVGAGIENPFEFGVGMMLAQSSAAELMPDWARTVSWRKEATQHDLFSGSNSTEETARETHQVRRMKV